MPWVDVIPRSSCGGQCDAITIPETPEEEHSSA